jgi:hypothetical protein
VGVYTLLQAQTLISTVVLLAIFAVDAFALVDALTRPARAYLAADKLNKPAWSIILGLALAAHVLVYSTLLSLAGLIAALVYLLDVRPALRELTRR